MRFTASLLVIALLATAYAADSPRLEYEGISAATTLADLKARFPDRVDMISDDPADAKHPVSASLRFQPPLGRATFLDYYEIAGEQRVIRLFFSAPGAVHPENEHDLSCNVLLTELRGRFGKEGKVDEFNEEAFHHVKHIWTQGNQSMALDCGHLPKQPVIVDRLFFECRGTCG